MTELLNSEIRGFQNGNNEVIHKWWSYNYNYKLTPWVRKLREKINVKNSTKKTCSSVAQEM